MNKKLGYRAWYYFRMGWSTYFAFIFAAVNTLVVTYYLAIENISQLQVIFQTFSHYLVITLSIGLPILILIGYIHYKKIPAYSSEVEIVTETHPFFYKLPPGYQTEVLYPLYLTMLQTMIKLSKNEKLTEDELKKITEIEKNLTTLINGGWIGKPKRMS